MTIYQDTSIYKTAEPNIRRLSITRQNSHNAFEDGPFQSAAQKARLLNSSATSISNRTINKRSGNTRPNAFGQGLSKIETRAVYKAPQILELT